MFLLTPIFALLITYGVILMIAMAYGAAHLALVVGFFAALYYFVVAVFPGALRLLFGGFSSLLLFPSETLFENCLMSAISGAAAGTILGVLSNWKVLKSRVFASFLKASFSKDILTHQPGALGNILLGAVVGLVVGSIAGAAGIPGIHNWFTDSLSPHILLAQPSSLVAIISGGGVGGLGGPGGHTGFGLLVLLFFIILFHGVISGMLAGVIVGTFKGALFGSVKGATAGLFKDSTTEALARGSQAVTSHKIVPGWIEGLVMGAACGAVIGFVHAVSTIVAFRHS